MQGKGQKADKQPRVQSPGSRVQRQRGDKARHSRKSAIRLPPPSGGNPPAPSVGGQSAILGLWIIVALLHTLFTPTNVFAQMSGGGWIMSLYGTVQVEPGSDVATLQVKDEKIRFAIQNVQCSDRNFSAGRFMSDVTQRDPGLRMKGAEEWLEMLVNERPNKRVLQMNGVYYPDSRLFVINKLARFSGTPGLQPR
jgi:hypothetical protein